MTSQSCDVTKASPCPIGNQLVACDIKVTANCNVVIRLLASKEITQTKKGKGSPYLITEGRVPELILVPGSQPAGDVSHKPGGRLPLLSTGPQLPSQPLRGLLPVSLLGEHRHHRCEQFASDSVAAVI